MKKTTRNYLWVLVSNALLMLVVGVLWQVRLEAAPPAAKPPVSVLPAPVLRGEFADVKLLPKPKPVQSATYLAGFEKRQNIKSLKGEWVIVNLWASWCAPCVAELPSLQKLADAYAGKGLRVVAISMDDASNVAELEEAMAGTGINKYKVARNWDDKGEISDTLWPMAAPTTYVLTPDMRVFATLEGSADWFGDDAKAFAESLLKASKPVQAQR